MDSDLIKLVNKLQDTFHNLGEALYSQKNLSTDNDAGGELDMPQLVVVRVQIFLGLYIADF